MNHYQRLGVHRDASSEDIKKAFRRLARDSHPDSNPEDTDAGQRFREYVRAYEVLSDPEKRAAYDRGETIGVSILSRSDIEDLVASLFQEDPAESFDTSSPKHQSPTVHPRPSSLPERSRPSPFKVWDFFIAFGIGLVVATFTSLAVFIAFPPDLSGDLTNITLDVAEFLASPEVFWPMAYGQWLGMFIGIWAVGRLRKATLADFGLPIEPKDARGALWGLAGYGGVVVYSLILSGLGVEAPAQGVALAISGSDQPLFMVLAVLGAGVLAPLTEELLYRGVLQGSLRKRFVPVSAILITSGVFAVSHFQTGSSLMSIVVVLLLPIFAISLVFGWLTERDDGRIGRAFFAHAAFNSLQVLLLFSGTVEL